MQKQSYLNKLIGKKLTSTDINTSTAFAINKPNDKGRMSIVLHLIFEDYRLEIYNPIKIFPDKKLDDMVKLRVVETLETEYQAELVFETGYKLIVDMRDEVYSDPEAMCLSGPDNFWVVWN
jgi:hypothetical protein